MGSVAFKGRATKERAATKKSLWTVLNGRTSQKVRGNDRQNCRKNSYHVRVIVVKKKPRRGLLGL